MADLFRRLYLSTAMAAVAAALTACGGSNNLDDPVTEIKSSCVGATCVSGQFVDEPVAGLNYRCENVVGETSATGMFSCPNNSVATFYLKAKNGTREIVLGSVKIAKVVSVNNYQTVKFLQITPRNLVENGNAIDDLTAPENKVTQVLNIIRLLQAMGDPTDAYPGASGRITLTDERKKAIEALETDFSSALFATSNFDSLIQPVLAKVGTTGATLPTTAAAIDRYMTGFRAIQAGVYEANPQVFSGFVDLEKLNLLDVGVVGQSGSTVEVGSNRISQKALEGFLFMLDRDGKSLGFGLEWLDEVQTSPSDASDLSIPRSSSEMRFKSAPVDLTPVSNNIGFNMSGLIKPNFSFHVGAAGTGENLGTVQITAGIMEHGFILGHPVFYRNLFGLSDSEPVDPKKIGAWKRLGPTGLTQYEGNATIQRFRTFDPFLDPVVWKTLSTLPSGQNAKPVFPLHLTMTLRNNDARPLSGCGANGCVVGRVDFTVLENGNIVSDVDRDCSALKTDGSDQDAEGQREYRLGSVAALIQELSSSYFSPVMLIPHIPGWEALYGAQIGMTTSAGGGKVKIGFSAVHAGSVSILDNEAENSVAPATWVNYLRFHRLSQTHSGDPVKEGVQVNVKGEITPKFSDEIPTAQGVISDIQLQTCYNPLPKP